MPADRFAMAKEASAARYLRLLVVVLSRRVRRRDWSARSRAKAEAPPELSATTLGSRRSKPLDCGRPTDPRSKRPELGDDLLADEPNLLSQIG